MSDLRKTQADLMAELEVLRARVRELDRAEIEHARVEESLRESEAKYRGIFENANDMIYSHDMEGNFTSANPATVRTYGYSLEEFLKLDITYVVDAAYVPIARENIRKKLEGMTYTEPYELLTRARDGSPVWVEVSSRLIREQGRPVGVQGILRDITERKRAEEALRQARDELERRVQERTAELTAANEQLQREVAEHRRTEAALRESERRYRLLAENVTDVIWTTDLDLKFTYISPSTTHLRGYTVEEAMSQRLDDMLVPASYEAAMKVFQDLPPPEKMTEEDLHRSWTLELEVARKDGSTAWTEVKTSLLRDSDGRPVGLLGVTREITERKRAEGERAKLQEQLHQAQKMEAVGQLAAGVAHDFTNLLALILGHTEQAKRAVPGRANVHESLGMIEQVGQQATEVAKSLLTFSRNLPSEKRPVDLGALVAESTRLLRHMLPASVELAAETGCDPPLWVHADRAQMQQVILNLIINARDAMPEGGALHVRVRPEPVDGGRVDAEEAGGQPRLACIEVSDTGVGMPSEVRSRIFEPFFTTKPRGEGTGLGLSIVHGIVVDHGGRVEVRSKVGAGSTFTVVLPCVEAGQLPTGAKAAPARPGRGGLILLAEHHRLLREIMVSSLRSLDFEVVSAGDGRAALDQYERHRDEIRLIILDAGLRTESGFDPLGPLEESERAVPTVLISDEVGGELEDGRDRRVVLLRRPFAMPELCRLVQGILDEGAGQGDQG